MADFHYSITPDDLVDDESISWGAKSFYLLGYRYCLKKSCMSPRTYYPLDFFAQKRGVSKRTIQRHKAELIDGGWLVEQKRFNKTNILFFQKFRVERNNT